MADEANPGGEEGSEAGAGGDEAAVAAKAAEDAAAAKAAEEGNGKDPAPIQYDAFQMPEGMDVDADALAGFPPLSQEHKLPQDVAQKFVDVYAKGLQVQAKAHAEAWTKAMGEWRAAAEADPEIGGDKFKETEAHVALALKKFGPPNHKDEKGNDLGTNPLQEILKVTGTGNHVEIVRLLSKVGKILADDTLDFGRHLGEAPKTRADILFPTQGQQ